MGFYTWATIPRLRVVFCSRLHGRKSPPFRYRCGEHQALFSHQKARWTLSKWSKLGEICGGFFTTAIGAPYSNLWGVIDHMVSSHGNNPNKSSRDTCCCFSFCAFTWVCTDMGMAHGYGCCPVIHTYGLDHLRSMDQGYGLSCGF